MLKDPFFKSVLIENRLLCLEAIKHSLSMYKETNDETFIEIAKSIGIDSQKLKEDIESMG